MRPFSVNDEQSRTSNGYVKKVAEACPVQSEEVDFERDLRSDKYYVFSSRVVVQPTLSIEQIMGSRRSSYMLTGLYFSLGAAAYVYDYQFVTAGLCFLAAGPITYLYKMKRVMLNKILEVELKEDRKSVILRTAFKTVHAKIADIKPKGEYMRVLAKSKPFFFATKHPQFEPPEQIEMTLGDTLFLEVKSEDGRVQRMAFDLDYLLYQVDNFDLLADIFLGDEQEVGKYLLEPKFD